MKKNILLVFLLFSVISFSQTKKVLLEEYTGAYCSQCPLGTYYVDSMLTLHPNLITVALHAYTTPDAMLFAEIDTLYDTYSQGAPLGAVDRICTSSSSNYTAIFVNQWNTNIQQRLAVPAVLTINISPSWNSATRNITAQVSIDIHSNMPAGDYRLSMYVVEDSVTGTGPGYDQYNVYDMDPNSPFYGMGNPIVGFVHKHVARALLPSSWGLQGLIPPAPVTGQNFTHTFNYTLPVSYDETQVHLVAFVYRFTGNHTGDEVLNVSEEKLLQSPSAVNTNIPVNNRVVVYPNPFSGYINLEFERPAKNVTFILYDLFGKKITSQENISGSAVVITPVLDSGIYFYRIIDSQNTVYSGKITAD